MFQTVLVIPLVQCISHKFSHLWQILGVVLCHPPYQCRVNTVSIPSSHATVNLILSGVVRGISPQNVYLFLNGWNFFSLDSTHFFCVNCDSHCILQSCTELINLSTFNCVTQYVSVYSVDILLLFIAVCMCNITTRQPATSPDNGQQMYRL